MFRVFLVYRRLNKLGILGMNQRNASCILDHNPRKRFPVVDDKLRLHYLCQQIGVPTPAIYGEIGYNSMLRRLPEFIGDHEDFVIKPNRGSAGRGVWVMIDRHGDRFLRHNGESLTLDDLRQHISDILSGMYSLGGQPDKAILQQRIRLHPTFEPITHKGIPDVRVVVYRNEPAMAMLRLPTRTSGGRANLHQGGVGVGVDLRSGITHHAVQQNLFLLDHPDTGMPVIGVRVPYWREILEMSRRVAQSVQLGYLGVDIVIDAEEGPMLLEANARPGLAIQMANACGLLPRLSQIDALLNGQRKGRAPASGQMINGRHLRRSA
jgi:alpha-L-glutamate ligase-like protein